MRRYLNLFLTALLSLTVLAGCGDGSESGATEPDGSASAPGGGDPEGVEFFRVDSADHVDGKVDYEQNPPVGGDHDPAWLNCGFYTVEVPNENVVHDLEHGAIWITFTSAASEADLATIKGLVDGETHITASLYPEQTSPFVLSAWARQLKLDSIDDPRVQQFIDAYIRGGVAPEKAPCDRGIDLEQT